LKGHPEPGAAHAPHLHAPSTSHPELHTLNFTPSISHPFEEPTDFEGTHTHKSSSSSPTSRTGHDFKPARDPTQGLARLHPPSLPALDVTDMYEAAGI
jgi:hypothetical protein